MNTDIRLKTGFLDNSKIVKLQRRKGADAILSLLRFWFYVAENKPTGELCGMDSEDIDIACGNHAEGMHDALLELGFIEKTKTGYKVHDWKENQPWAANSEVRSKAASKAASERWKPQRKSTVRSDAPRMLCAYEPHAEGNAPFLSFPSLSLPTQLTTSEGYVALTTSKTFSEAWVAWETHRKEKKQKLTPSTVESQLKKFSKHKPEIAAQMISQSIDMGWTGLFDLKSGHNFQQKTTPAPDNYPYKPFSQVDPRLPR